MEPEQDVKPLIEILDGGTSEFGSDLPLVENTFSDPSGGTEIQNLDFGGEQLGQNLDTSSNNPKQFWCYRCKPPVQISRAWNLKRHIISRHMGEKPYNCILCSKRFVSKQSLNMHHRSQHMPRRSLPIIQQHLNNSTKRETLLTSANLKTPKHPTPRSHFGSQMIASTSSIQQVILDDSDSTSDSELKSDATQIEIGRLRQQKNKYKNQCETLRAKLRQASSGSNEPSKITELHEAAKMQLLQSKLADMRKDMDKLMQYTQEKEKESELLKQENTKLKREKEDFHAWLLRAPVFQNNNVDFDA